MRLGATRIEDKVWQPRVSSIPMAVWVTLGACLWAPKAHGERRTSAPAIKRCPKTLDFGLRYLREKHRLARACRIARRCPLRGLTVVGVPESTLAVRKLMRCPRRRVHLDLTSYADGDDRSLLLLMRSARGLRGINLHRSSSTGRFLRDAKRLPPLRFLRIVQGPFELSPAIGRLKNLESFMRHGRLLLPDGRKVLHRPRLTFFAALGRLRRLQRVHLSALAPQTVTRDALMALGRAPRLRSLTLWGTFAKGACAGFGGKVGTKRRRFAQLEHLDLIRQAFDRSCLRQIASLPKLKYLRIGFSSIGDGGLGSLAHAPALQHLVLDQTKSKTPLLQVLPRLKRLKKVSVAHGQLSWPLRDALKQQGVPIHVLPRN